MKYFLITDIILLMQWFFYSCSFGQTISGQVLDATHNEPLPNASVITLDDNTCTITDEKGYFTLQMLHNGSVTIQISHLGYISEKKHARAGDFVKFTLKTSETNLREVIVKSSQVAEAYSEVPGVVNLITRKQLRQNNEASPAPVFNQIPGVYMHSGSLNTNRITIRGVGARTPYGTNKVRAYYDDIPLTSGEGETTVEDIDLAAIQRIEVIKGPSSSVYGSGLGGTINLTSLQADNKNTLSSKSTIGSYGFFRTNSRAELAGEHNQLNLMYSTTHTDGYRQNSEYDRRSFIFTSKSSPNPHTMISVLGLYTHLKAYIPSSINEETFKTSPSSAAINWYQAQGYEMYNKANVGISYHSDITSNLKSTTSTFLTFRNADEPRPFNILKESTVATGLRSKLMWDTKVLQREMTWSAGFEYFSDWYQWSTYENQYKQYPGTGSRPGSILSDNKEHRYYYNLFAQLDWTITQKLSLQTGINNNKTTYELIDLYADSLDQSGKYSFNTTWSPRVGIVYHIKNGHSIYTSVSHGFSPPSVAETLTPEGSINTNIQPESGWNYEIGSKDSWLNDRLYTELSVYRMNIKNLLVAQRTGPDTYVGVNAGKTLHQGLEILIHMDLVKNSPWTVRPFLSATLMDYRFDDFISEEIDYSGNDLTGVPSHVFNFGIDVDSEIGLYIYGNYQSTGDIPLNDANSLYSNSYSLINLKTGYKRRFQESFQFDISMGVNNLLDENYASMVLVNAVGFGGSAPRYYYPGLPRNYYIALELSYNF
ncbi:TonB-dependent receptor [Fulvivirga sp. 29W222]|uniref:TonB-dependent receptor n=1 Tax=Fulvivirga marina TaxID=2494733 RepID=A0A937G5R6_9BACT|nr:TonB-dependent receptor [Fulvivirga marina]MBL6448931.1 TonB-dependent receptor [Fulvivirga marina]